MSSFNRKIAIIKFLKANSGQEFTAPEIVAWMVDAYPKETARKEQTSKNKTLLGITDKRMRKKIIINLYSNEFNLSFRTALQKIEPRIKITKEHQPKYCYTDKVVNYEFAIHEEFDLKSTVVKFFKDNPGKEFTSYQIATWIISTYPEEVERKEQTSNDRRLLSATSKVQKRKILIMIYRNELNKQFRADIQKIEPKIKIIKKGIWFKYCYVNYTDKIVNYDDNKIDRKAQVIKLLKDNPGKEYTNSQIAKWLVSTYPEEAERKAQTSNDKRLLNTTNKVERKKIVIKIYIHELNRVLSSSLQKIEPKIKITKRGREVKYCYVNNNDKIFDKFKVMEILENHKQQEFTAFEMAQLLLSTNSK